MRGLRLSIGVVWQMKAMSRTREADRLKASHQAMRIACGRLFLPPPAANLYPRADLPSFRFGSMADVLIGRTAQPLLTHCRHLDRPLQVATRSWLPSERLQANGQRR